MVIGVRGLGLAGIALAFAGAACGEILGIPDRTEGAHLSCTDGKCVCTGGFADCDESPRNGCEADPESDPKHCGACGNECQNGTCVAGECRCEPGAVDCDGDPKNGCEAVLDRDPKNCEVCGHDCLGGACQGSRCQPVTLYTQTVQLSLLLHQENLFVAVCAGDAVAPVVRLPTMGGMPEPFALAVGCGIYLSRLGETLYWSDGGTIYANPLDAPAKPTPIHPVGAPVNGVLAAGEQLYWGVWDPATSVGGLYRSPLEAIAPEQLSTTQVRGLAVDEQRFYWSDASGVHLLDHGGSAITDLPIGGVGALRIFGGALFAETGNGITKVPTDGSTPTVIVPGAGTYGFVVDPDAVYWLDYFDGNLNKLVIGEDQVEALVVGPGLATTYGLVADDKALYWFDDAKLSRLAK